MGFRDKENAVLDIGSGSITLMVAGKTMGDYCRVTFEKKVSYEGIKNGSFVDKESVKSAIKSVFQRLKEKHGKVKKVFVGVPAEFSLCRVINSKLDQIKHKKVEQPDIDSLVSMSNPFAKDPDRVLIDATPLYFIIDDDDEKYINPIGKVTRSLESRISYIAGDKAELDFLKETLKDNGVNEIVFLSAPRCETLGLYGTSARDLGVVLVDCGYKSTSVIVNSCDGIEYLFSFSVGKYNIIDWIAQGLGITFDESKLLLDKVDLSFVPTDETFSVNSNGVLITFPCKQVIDMTVECIRIICTYINKCFDSITDTRIKNKDIHLTGSGLDFRGIESCMANWIGKTIIKDYPTFESNYKKASYSRVMGLVYYVTK